MISEKEWNKKIDSLKAKGKATKKELKDSVEKAIVSSIPDEKFGIMFSGGVDSSLIAFLCKQKKADFICYAVGLENSADVAAAKKAAKLLKVKLKVKIFSLEEVEEVLKEVTGIIGVDVMRVGVGSVVYAAMKLAEKDGIKKLYSGLGAEEIFAGYDRHVSSKDINKECWKGLKTMWKRDITRDNAIADKLGFELITPFLDFDLIKTAMQVPGSRKVNKEQKKVILREVAEDLGLPREIAWRRKQAAQYGSKFDRAILRLSKRGKFRYKKQYLEDISGKRVKLGALISSGKDSVYAMYLMQKKGYEISCIITLRSKNPDSYMFHTPTIDLVKLQAEAMGIPLIERDTKGEKEKELKDLKKILEKAKKKYKIEGITTGALFSNYQKERIEKVADSLKLKVFSPLWHMDQEKEMRQIIKDKFKFIMTKIAAEGLDKKWLGKEITNKDVDKLTKISGINIAGEGGEFESLVIDGPIFKKSLKIIESFIKEESRITAELIIKKAKLVKK